MAGPSNAINVGTAGAVSFSGTAFTGGTLPVIYGGTGAITFGINGVVLSGATGTTALTAATLNNGQIIIGATGSAAIAASIVGGSGVTVTPGANSITISSSATGISWTDEAANFAALADAGYFTTAAVVATLPATPSQGDSITFVADAAGAVTITATGTQVIRVGAQVSAAAGTCASTAIGDSIRLTYRTANTSWVAVSAPQGVWIVT